MVLFLLATALAIRTKKREPVVDTVERKIYKLDNTESELTLTSSEEITDEAKFTGELHGSNICFIAHNGKYLVPTAEMNEFDFSDKCEEANMYDIKGLTEDNGLRVRDSFGHIYVFREIPKAAEEEAQEGQEATSTEATLEANINTAEASKIETPPPHLMEGLLNIPLFFKSAWNNYMGSTEDHNAWRSVNMLDYETWIIEPHGNDVVIRSNKLNTYLSGKADGRVDTVDSIGTDEVWTPQKIGDMWYFRSAHNTLLAADGTWEVRLVDQPAEEAKWEIRPYVDYGLAVDFNHINRDVFIRSTFGTRLQCRGDHQVRHIGSSGQEYVWHIVPIGDGKVNIRCQAYGTYLLVNDGGWVGQANEPHEFETFTLERAGDRVQIRSYFGNYIRSFHGDTVNTAGTADDWERWYIDIA